MLIIKNGRVMDPASGTDEVMDLRIERGIITEMGQFGAEKHLQTIDASGLVVAPGLVDAHVHFRDPGQTHKEDLCSGSAAAAAGGFTTVVCMANTVPPVDCEEVLTDLRWRAASQPIHVLNAACVTKGLKGEALTDMEALWDAGAALFSDDGIPIRDEVLLYEAMKLAKSLGCAISLHEEDPQLIGSSGVNRGRVSEQLGVSGAPALAEQTLTARDCLLALETGARIDIQHVSSAVTVDLIRFMKSLGADIWAEATPQHFSLTEEAVAGKGALAKVNPPLRTEADRLALIRGLADGTIDMIVTDHAPHAADEKALGLEKAPSGMIGLETALSLGITNLVRTGYLTLTELLKKMTVMPARFLDLPCGRLGRGMAADLVIFDPDRKWTVTEADFHSRSRNSPFIGMTLYGKPLCTICEGNIAFRVPRESW